MSGGEKFAPENILESVKRWSSVFHDQDRNFSLLYLHWTQCAHFTKHRTPVVPPATGGPAEGILKLFTFFILKNMKINLKS